MIFIVKKMLRKSLPNLDLVCYINLAYRKDRKKHILAQLDKLGISKEKIIRIEGVQDLMNGHRGCASSHIAALEEAQKREISVLIIEDDCQFIESPDEIEALCNYFFSTIKNDWDVFMLGGRIKKHEATKFNNVYRVLSADCAHAYWVHKNYIPKLLFSFKNSLALMKNDIFSCDSRPYAIDTQWRSLQEKDRWYVTRVIAYQIDSYSDIEWEYRRWGVF